MRAIRTHLWAFAIWGMIPLTVIAGTPRIACLCANGQYKHFCNRLSQCCRGEVETPAGDGVSSCCRTSRRTKSERTAAAKSDSVAGCCHHGPTRKCGQGQQAHSGRCCNPVAVMPLLPPVAQQPVIPDLAPVAILALSVDLLQASVISPAHESAWNPALPVPDLLIAHQVFLI